MWHFCYLQYTWGYCVVYMFQIGNLKYLMQLLLCCQQMKAMFTRWGCAMKFSCFLSQFLRLFASPFMERLTQVKCSVRGDLGPACNSAGMIDRHALGIDHLYTKPVYRNLKVLQAVHLCFCIHIQECVDGSWKISMCRNATCPPMVKFHEVHLPGVMLLLILKVF